MLRERSKMEKVRGEETKRGKGGGIKTLSCTYRRIIFRQSAGLSSMLPE